MEFNPSLFGPDVARTAQLAQVQRDADNQNKLAAEAYAQNISNWIADYLNMGGVARTPKPVPALKKVVVNGEVVDSREYVCAPVPTPPVPVPDPKRQGDFVGGDTSEAKLNMLGIGLAEILRASTVAQASLGAMANTMAALSAELKALRMDLEK